MTASAPRPGTRPGRASLAETATLDAGLAQQLAVLLLRHTLAALLDHGAHTTCLSKPCGAGPARTVDAACIRTGRRPGPGAVAHEDPRTNRSSVAALAQQDQHAP